MPSRQLEPLQRNLRHVRYFPGLSFERSTSTDVVEICDVSLAMREEFFCAIKQRSEFLAQLSDLFLLFWFFLASFLSKQSRIAILVVPGRTILPIA